MTAAAAARQLQDLQGLLRRSRALGFALPRRRSQPVACEDVAAALPGILDGGSEAPHSVVAHVETCLGCQAELARYRRLVRLLQQLRTAEIEPPAGVVADVFAALEEAANRRVIRSVLTGRRVMYGGAVAAAVGATAGGVVLARAHATRNVGRVGGMADPG